jgi:hypothetical protein
MRKSLHCKRLSALFLSGIPVAFPHSMKNLILCGLASIGLISLVACSDGASSTQTSSTTQQSASMQTDTKDMHPTH